jgi:23S rRNA pseudouridine955/2504/2580 synthase
MQNKERWRISKKQAGMRLLQFLRDNCPSAPSVKALKRAIDGKLCMVNKQIETFSSYTLEENDVVVLSSKAFEEPKKVCKIPVLYEDKHLLVINKPAGLVSDRTSLNTSFELVHRLDKETSGVLILAKSTKAKEQMAALFKERKVHKLYLALVDGIVDKEEGTIDNYLGQRSAFQGQTVYGTVPRQEGQRAITHWQFLKKGKGATLVRCMPHTGRTHQLRAHLSGMGHPILGDTQYGKQFVCAFKPQRNLLHAYSVAFPHPVTQEEIKVIAPIPVDFKQALEELKVSFG